ncbi:ATP-grasp domain-containing protein [Micromonospora sp. KC213]|uniref:ATP-grasp domain-containing protein n=1 Tax=Micromonospora sp. KC213 TaxID=2530378 RepID=UPI001404A8A7|nr:ATP-grasp domain-containing protein [Micromonospora sp. KC213]
MNILLTSAGRRNYLVQWFVQALAGTGRTGRVFVADRDPRAPAQVAADGFIPLPPYRSADYLTTLGQECARHEISLLVPLNDYELSALAGEPAAVLAAAGTRVLVPRLNIQRTIEDKYACAELVRAAGVATPTTRLGSDLLADPAARDDLGDRLVVKHRFGSGSSGLVSCTTDDLEAQLRVCALTAPDRSGLASSDPDQPRYDLVVVQSRILGVEYGIDAVADFRGRHLACLARRKLSMRAGETDRAVTVDPRPFAEVGGRIADAVAAPGLIDLDVIVDETGRSWVIDVNPRFGGGYPFSHLAGADVPACYAAWHSGLEHDPKWLTATPGVTAAKYESLTTIAGFDRE